MENAAVPNIQFSSFLFSREMFLAAPITFFGDQEEHTGGDKDEARCGGGGGGGGGGAQ